MQTQGNAELPDNNWQQEQVFVSAEDYFASLLAGIAAARHSIDMDFYIFDYDSVGQAIIEALLGAARRKVKIRLVIDGFGSVYSARRIASILSAANIQVQIFHPFPFSLNVFRWSNEPGSMLQRFLHFLISVNQRDHHKLCIIDHQHLWTGSFNLSKVHLDPGSGGSGWHDYGVKISDPGLEPVIATLGQLFEKKSPTRPKLYLQKIRSNITARLRKISNNILVRRLRNAHQRIWICNAYFSPSPRVLRAIRQARQKGVDVRLILPAHSDIFFMPMLSRTYYKKLLELGISIYEYQPAILHAKLLLIDQHCMMGSTNLNHRSFFHDRELDIVLSQPHTISEIEHCLLADIAASKKITLADIRQHSITLFFYRFLRLFRYWL